MFPEWGGTSDQGPDTERGNQAQIASDSQVKSPSLDAHRSHFEKYAADYPELVSFHDYGAVTGAAGKLRLFGLSMKRDLQELTGLRPAVLITDLTHGNEYTGVVDRLAGYLAENSRVAGPVAEFFDKGGVVYMAPVVNPTGYELRSRRTRDDVDLNRVYVDEKISEYEEVSALLSFLEESLMQDGAELRVNFDYHCCSKSSEFPVFLRPTNFSDPSGPLANKAAEKHIAVFGEMVSKSFANAQVGPSSLLLRKTADDPPGEAHPGTSKDYQYYESLESIAHRSFVLSVTFEGLKNVNRERNPNQIREHFELWTLLLGRIAAEPIVSGADRKQDAQ